MLVLSNQYGKDNTANNIPRPIETMIKSINQAMNLSIHLSSIIVSVSVFFVADKDGGSVVSVLGLILFPSIISTTNPAIRTIIRAIFRIILTIMPLNEVKLS